MALLAQIRETARGGAAPYLRSANPIVMIGCLAGLLVLSLIGPLMTFNDTASSVEGSPVRQALSIGLFVVVFIAVKPWANPRRLLVVPLLITVALAWFWLSVIWSVDPSIATRRLILTTVVVWSVFIIVAELGYERTMLVLRFVLVGALIANYLTVLLFPTIGMHTSNEVDETHLIGDWRGFMMHKNLAGPVCVMTLFVFLFDARRIPAWLRWGVVAGAGFFLFQTTSRTSFALGLAGVAVGYLFLQYRLRYRGLLAALTIVVATVATVAALVYNDPLLGQFTDPKAFTGRPVIWKALSSFIGDHPLLGAGFGSFWAVGPISPVFQYATGFATTVTTGHNGYLDLASQVGIPAMLFAVAVTMIVPLVKLFTSAATTNERGAVLACIIFFAIGANFTETSLFDRDSVVQVFLMIAIALGSVLAGDPKRRGAPVSFPGRARHASARV